MKINYEKNSFMKINFEQNHIYKKEKLTELCQWFDSWLYFELGVVFSD